MEPKEKEVEKDEKELQTLDTLVTLKDLTLSVLKSEFVCIIGDVGSGKSSLLSALIGDLLVVGKELIEKYGMGRGLTKPMGDADELKKFQEDMIKNSREMAGKQPI